MKIKSINIKNYKSIKELTIPLQSYGDGENESQTTFLIGINESGKSTILKAISSFDEKYDHLEVIYTDFGGIGYDKDFHKGSEKGSDIEISAEIELSNMDFLKPLIREKLNLPESFVNAIQVNMLQRCVSINNNKIDRKYIVKINEDLPFSQYAVSKNKIKKDEKIYTIKPIESSESEAKELTKDYLEYIIATSLKDDFNQQCSKIQIWKPEEHYLINKPVNLSKFRETPSEPFKNMFSIYGKNTDYEIKKTIDEILTDSKKCRKFENEMSDVVTNHINKIWKEHKIKISVTIDIKNSLCEIDVKEESIEHYYSMSLRSDGFKQFVSLILSLSAQNECNELSNNIILIDEPELHLHPSAIRSMRDELLKIGKNNHVIVATHSNYMVDTEVPERHWLVKKEQGETSISQLNNDIDFYDDKVLHPAFGLNFFKELLPENIIVVEGKTDEMIIRHAIRKLNTGFSFSVKEAKSVTKTSSFARFLSEENVNIFILLDSDNDGRNGKKSIITKQSKFYSESNVFTLKDLLKNLPDDSTIEDLLPINFIKPFFDERMKMSFDLNENEPILKQLQEQKPCQENKQNLNSLKTKLSEEFCNKYKTKQDIETQAPKLAELVKQLCNKIEDFKKSS